MILQTGTIDAPHPTGLGEFLLRLETSLADLHALRRRRAARAAADPGGGKGLLWRGHQRAIAAADALHGIATIRRYT